MLGRPRHTYPRYTSYPQAECAGANRSGLSASFCSRKRRRGNEPKLRATAPQERPVSERMKARTAEQGSDGKKREAQAEPTFPKQSSVTGAQAKETRKAMDGAATRSPDPKLPVTEARLFGAWRKEAEAGKSRKKREATSRTHFPKTVRQDRSESEGNAKGRMPKQRCGRQRPEPPGNGHRALRSLEQGPGTVGVGGDTSPHYASGGRRPSRLSRISAMLPAKPVFYPARPVVSTSLAIEKGW